MTSTDLPLRPSARPAPRRAGRLPALVGTALNAGARLAPRTTGRLALELWRRPGRPRRCAPASRIVHDAARRGVVAHAGTEVATYAWGDGERPVLLVHGWGARASRFADLVVALTAAGYSPVAYDAWGHGATPGPVRTIVEHQVVIAELERRHGPFVGVVAHSFGVPVALYAARSGLTSGRLVALSGMSEFGYVVDTFGERLGLGARANRELRSAIERTWFCRGHRHLGAVLRAPLPDREVLVVHDAADRVRPPHPGGPPGGGARRRRPPARDQRARARPDPARPRGRQRGRGLRRRGQDMSGFRIRRAGPADRACVAALLRGLSPDSAYRRFQTALGPEPSPAMLDALLPTGPHGGAVLAHAGPFVIGHGVWQRAGATSVAEIGVVVADSQQRRGIGSALAETLLADLAARGMDAVEVYASATNEAVSRMVAASAPAALRERDGATITYRFAVDTGVARTVA